MGLYNEIKKFAGKFIRNPIKTSIVAFLIWRIMKSETKESICEGFKIISKKGDKELIFDGKLYHIVKNGRDISTFKDEKQAMSNMEGMKMNINIRIESLLKGGDVPDEKFDAVELAKGIEVEKEHTDDLEVAKQIAKAHLLEDKDYYIKLAKMEGEEKLSERINKLKE